jgi:hypothetical protein
MTGLAWGVGLAAAGAIFGNCNWGGGDVNINVNKAANIDRNFDRTKVQGGRWQHDGSHRQGVAYRDNATREKYSRNVGGAEGRNDFSGRDSGNGARANTADRANAGDRSRTGDRANGGDRASVADRSNGGDRASAGDRSSAGNRAGTADRSAGGDRGGVSNRANTGQVSRASDRVGGAGGNGFSGGRDNAFQGVGAGGATQRSADRGRSSVQSSGFSRPSGGAGGGGMRASGGRGGRR